MSSGENEGSDAMTTPARASSCEECKARGSRGGDADVAFVDRREFFARGALAAVGALLVSACGGGTATAPNGTGGGQLNVTVSNFPALATVSGIARVDSGQGTPVAAVRTGATTFAAFSLICPHFGCTVGIVSGRFGCPCHGAQFAASGQWIGGQPTGNLTALTTTYNTSTGVLTITG